MGIEDQSKAEDNRRLRRSPTREDRDTGATASAPRNRTCAASVTAAAAGALAFFAAGAAAQDAVEAGEQLYEEHCMGCHGEKLRNPGTTFDLRKLTANDRPRFDKLVMEGKGQMPPWRGTLDEADLDRLWAYVRAHAYDK
jgi:mono/diheme cytochrome c family protein